MTDPTPAGGILNPDTGAKARTVVRAIAGLATFVLSTLAGFGAVPAAAAAIAAGAGLALEGTLYTLTYGRPPEAR